MNSRETGTYLTKLFSFNFLLSPLIYLAFCLLGTKSISLILDTVMASPIIKTQLINNQTHSAVTPSPFHTQMPLDRFYLYNNWPPQHVAQFLQDQPIFFHVKNRLLQIGCVTLKKCDGCIMVKVQNLEALRKCRVFFQFSSVWTFFFPFFHRFPCAIEIQKLKKHWSQKDCNKTESVCGLAL